MHCLVYCPLAKGYWERLGLNYLVGSKSSFLDWCMRIWSLLDGARVATVVMVNNLVWRKKKTSVEEIVVSSNLSLNHWLRAQNNPLILWLSFLTLEDGVEH
uniref:Uncharacterized protein n=1 Tax=Cannabis sativa TaxID=3483 RepID=A0A803NYJ6_CANSA